MLALRSAKALHVLILENSHGIRNRTGSPSLVEWHQDDPLVSLVQGLVTPSKTIVNTSGEEQVEDISPTTIEAAKTLSRVASQKPKSIDKGRRYKRRKETKEKKEEASLAEAIRLDTLEKEEEAKPVHLDSLLAQRIVEEEELNEQQKQRRAQVNLKLSIHNEDRDLIKPKIEAMQSLSKSVLGSGYKENTLQRRWLNYKDDDPISGTNIPINHVPVAIKPPSIATYKIIKQGEKDSRAKGVIVDDAATPSTGVSRPRLSSGPSPLFRDVSGDAIHTELFPFSAGPYYATYPKDGVVSALKKQVSRLNDKLSSSYASFTKSKAKGKERKKKIKSLTKSLDNFDTTVARLFDALNQATILEAERDEEILLLKNTPPEFSSFFRGQFQGLVWKFLAFDKFSRVQGELLSLAASEEAVVNPFRV
ncbi:hypothetical protein Tco_0950935 [Tanacetum coccineum]|uniref:Uncharacterized protein n=1 Tax=Tanacetum coccineum TaxID=301880 RepID=A0ABQ5DT50_9ASTR